MTENKEELAMLRILDWRSGQKRKSHIFKIEHRSKYGARKCKIDGYTFDSAKESREYMNLKIRQMAHEIRDLEIHPTYPIIINDKLVCNVELDFRYYDNREKKLRHIDVKGFPTDLSKLKKKLLEAVTGIEVEWI